MVRIITVLRHLILKYIYIRKSDRHWTVGFCSFLLYLQHMISVNMKLDISRCTRMTFRGCRLHWSISFLMTLPKQVRQYWHSRIEFVKNSIGTFIIIIITSGSGISMGRVHICQGMVFLKRNRLSCTGGEILVSI